ncbi:MAG: hypothetical protein M0R75_11700 [Dehalococcoidia bacterium]|nr:hypothetical protein [Dehalococcoidia bacterium]
MPRYREYCPGRVVEQLTATLRIEAWCLLREGHEGDCAADPTRWRLRWAAPEAVEVSEEVGAEGEEPAGVVACRNGEHA